MRDANSAVPCSVSRDNLYTGFGLCDCWQRSPKTGGVTPGKEQTALVVHMKEQIRALFTKVEEQYRHMHVRCSHHKEHGQIVPSLIPRNKHAVIVRSCHENWVLATWNMGCSLIDRNIDCSHCREHVSGKWIKIAFWTIQKFKISLVRVALGAPVLRAARGQLSFQDRGSKCCCNLMKA